MKHFIAAATLIAAPVHAQEAPVICQLYDRDIIADLCRCIHIDDVLQRLSCYDRAAEEIEQHGWDVTKDARKLSETEAGRAAMRRALDQ